MHTDKTKAAIAYLRSIIAELEENGAEVARCEVDSETITFTDGGRLVIVPTGARTLELTWAGVASPAVAEVAEEETDATAVDVAASPAVLGAEVKFIIPVIYGGMN
ncbi:MAG: hypothetical protein WBK88_09215 [Methanothrix sp.]